MTMHKVAMGKHYYRKYIDEPVMSDRTLLVSVEDLIDLAFGPFEKNTVNFKLVQTILHILARQLRLLEQDVEITFDKLGVDIDTGRIRSVHDAYDRSDDEYSDEYTDEFSDEYDEDAYSSSSEEEEEEGKDGESVRGGEGRPGRKDRGRKGEKREKKERGEKGEKREKKERGEKGEKGEKNLRGEKGEKGEKKERGEKGEKGEKMESGGKGEKGEKKKRGEKEEKGEKERGEKEEKGEKGEKKERSEKEEKGEKKERGEKVEKGDKKERGEKGEKGEKKERGEKGEKEEKKERGQKGEKGDKKELGEKEEKGEKKERGEKGEKRRDKRGGKDMGITTGLGGEDDGVDAEGGGGHARREKRGRKGEDDVEEGEGAGGRRRGGRGKRGEVEGDEAEGGGGRRRGGRGRRGEDEDETEEGGGRHHGGPGRRGEDEDETEEGSGLRHGGRGRRGEDEGDEAEEGGRRLGGKSRDREDQRPDRHGERRGERRGERGGERREERGGEYDKSEDRGVRRRDGREGSGTSVSETTRRGDGKGGAGKILAAERGPATHGRVGSIEVVTASQFALLNDAVRRLEKLSGPLPMPALPDNEQLRKDLAKGRASLSDTMEAVQLNARVQAAEEGLYRMAGLLTQLAAAGALPPDFASRIGDLMAAVRKPSLTTVHGAPDLPFDFKAMFGHGTGADKRAGAGPKSAGLFVGDDEAGTDQADHSMKSVKPSTGRSAKPGEAEPPAFEAVHVTHNELQNILVQMKAALDKEIQSMTARANHSVEIASNTSRSVADKLAGALSIDDRISNLYKQTADYAAQLNGFDAGLSTQMARFQEQMTMMTTDLREGLSMFETANNNAETVAVLDLTERYENLAIELDNTAHLHRNLNILQQHISSELKNLVDCVEMLREQKADCDEVLDCLRDKADISRLDGLLYENDFTQASFEINERIKKTYEKFYKQDEFWKNVMRDLKHTCDTKAELINLIGLKNKATQDLNAIQEKLHQLEIMLGDPQAALLMRQMAAGAACGACLAPALMSLVDATHGKPKALPALRPSPLGAEDLCLGEIVLRPHDTRKHICHRWVGGSHTLVAGNIKRENSGPAQLQTIPTKKFEGYGFDGKLYMMEEELQPCAECNKFSTDEDGKVPPHSTTPAGGGDHV